ncbi:MAG: polymerase LigD, ligase domain protein [Verrucomicrobiales bacterium]|nr:polymerase LigD, ligase domain protein [Verrucomicrobiales bacterium]
MSLTRYQKKRNFSRTPEPEGHKPKQHKKALAFVIQKHNARRLHYDFRLEMEGVLKSWAVPKGVPNKKGDRRLAMHVEDHPLEYGAFEGNIPEGNYGAGSVMLWDAGTYEGLDEDPLEAYKKGKLRFALSGKKLKGDWSLVRMRGREEEGKEPWLLIKSGRDIPPVSVEEDDRSVISGKKMEEIAEGKRVWNSNRIAKSKAGKPRKAEPAKQPRTAANKRSPKSSAPPSLKELPKKAIKYIPPMKAQLVENVPSEGDWVYEIKWDGYRALALKSNGKVRLYSRRAREVTADFPGIAKAVAQLPVKEGIFDGEIVALDANGQASFQLLQNYKNQSKKAQPSTLVYYVFDLLNAERKATTGLPLLQRKQLLEAALKQAPASIRYSAHFAGDPKVLLEQAQKNRIEGLIAKRTDSTYEPDQRSGAWLKLKTVLEQEFVIGGYTEPKGTRSYFGALLLGYHEGGDLRFASKVGTGFDHELLQSLYKQFQKLKSNQVPFSDLPTLRKGKSANGLSRAEMQRCTWLQPELVCQIRFTEWTADGGLRHPVFLGLRDDKKAKEVLRERPVPKT